MTYLVDTHIVLWLLAEPDRIPAAVRRTLADPVNTLLLSAAVVWEIAIKMSIGSYTLTEPLEDFVNREVQRNELAILPVGIKHAAAVAQLPFHHRDPFDRMLIAQALADGLTLVTVDSNIKKYAVPIL